MSKEEKDFYNYVVIQFSGEFNMITDGSFVCSLMEVSYDEYWDIIENYSELMKKYPETNLKAQEKGRLRGRIIRGE